MLVPLFKTMRPKQWTKNVFVLAALLFSQNLLNSALLLRAVAAFGLFCLVSGCVYVFNDMADRDRDSAHPLKSRRPIASGTLAVWPAGLLAGALLLLALLLSARLSTGTLVAVCAYLATQLLYTLALKNVVILDVLVLAAGFVIRVVAGAVVIDVAISSWLLICTTLIALFLGLCKRRHELTSLGDLAPQHRRVLGEYTAYLLDQMIAVVAAATVVAYALYTVSEETVAKFGTANLLYTIPFVIYGLFRYLYLVHRREEGGRPEQTLLTDPPIMAAAVLYALTAAAVLYWPH